jgi:LysR family transcriptional regulator, hydrogen peroxide-inducible genes activator
MTALPTAKQLRYLVVLSEQLNFTRAAAACHITQSTLSAALRELEDLLDVRLVERDRQNVMMTPTGLEVVNRARVILAATQDLVQTAVGNRKPLTSSVRLGVIPTIAPFLLPRCLQKLRARYPKLRLALREDTTANLLLRLRDGDLDFAIIALPYDTEDLLVEELFVDDLWIVGRNSDPALKPALRGAPLHITPPLVDRLLLLEEGHCLRDHTLAACGTQTRATPSGVEATSLLTLVQMVESGLGVGLVPEIAVLDGLCKSPTLTTRKLSKPSPSRTIALVARRSTARVEEFKLLAKIFAEAKGEIAKKK